MQALVVAQVAALRLAMRRALEAVEAIHPRTTRGLFPAAQAGPQAILVPLEARTLR